MSGVAILRTILAENSALIAVIPADNIAAEDLPIKTVLPAIGLKQISGVPRLTMAMIEPNQIQTDRVQVTVMMKGGSGAPQGAGYPGVKAALALVRLALPNRNGTLAGLSGFWIDSILPDTVGPDFPDEATQIISQSQDYIVKWRTA